MTLIMMFGLLLIMNKYIVHIQYEDGSFSAFEMIAATIYDVMKKYPNAYLIDEV